MPIGRPTCLLAVACCALWLSAGVTPAGAQAGACSRVAAPDGSDGAAGTVEAPFRTVQRVIESLQPGDVGCLRGGTYDQEVTGPYVANFLRSGRAGSPITLRSYPGERARLRGVVHVPSRADHVTISGLDIDGRRSDPTDRQIGIHVYARNTVIENSTITNPASSCMTLGVEGWGYAIDSTVRNNVFHDCGVTENNLLDHAIYANQTRGGEIADNLILRSAGFGVHFYGSNDGVRVHHNVMHGNGGGVIFSGHGTHVSTNNLVEYNVITDSWARPGVQSWWGQGEMGTGNVARRNCVFNNKGREVDTSLGGFTADGNVSAAPRFRDAASSDFRLDAASACLELLGYDPAAGLGGRAEIAGAAGGTPRNGDQGAPGTSSGAGAAGAGPSVRVRLARRGQRLVARGVVTRLQRGSVRIAAYVARAPTAGYRKVATRVATVRGGRFSTRVSRFRHGQWRVLAALRGTSVRGEREASLADRRARRRVAPAELPPGVVDSGRQGLGEEPSAPGAPAATSRTTFGVRVAPGPLASGGYIGRGSHPGTAIVRVQERLAEAGIPVVVTGRFDARTERAVRRFQREHGLRVDGVVGRQTDAELRAGPSLAEPSGA